MDPPSCVRLALAFRLSSLRINSRLSFQRLELAARWNEAWHAGSLDQLRSMQQVKADWIVNRAVHEIAPVLKEIQSHHEQNQRAKRDRRFQKGKARPEQKQL